MRIEATSVDDYIEHVPERWRDSLRRMRAAIKERLPRGFEETLSYGMIGFVVPKSLYPQGYHAKKDEPLPFISLAAQKEYISLYHLGIYAVPGLFSWFVEAYEKEKGRKLNIGKSCMRFKKDEEIPYGLIRDLCSRMSVDEWIRLYEKGH